MDNTSQNGGDPRTYKKVPDDSHMSINYQNDFNMNVSPTNHIGTNNSDPFNINAQQTNSSISIDYSSTSMTNGSGSNNVSSNGHSTGS